MVHRFEKSQTRLSEHRTIQKGQTWKQLIFPKYRVQFYLRSVDEAHSMVKFPKLSRTKLAHSRRASGTHPFGYKSAEVGW